MSDFVLHKGQRPSNGFFRRYYAEPSEIVFNPQSRTEVTLTNGKRGVGSCLGCGTAPCIQKDVSELVLAGNLESFPGDPTLDVCPTGAITFDGSKGVASVSADACIGCGLCAVRCPYGAISLKDGAVAVINADDVNKLVRNDRGTGDHPAPARVGKLAELKSRAASSLPTSVASLSDGKALQLVRNLLHEVGLNARVRRRGDTNMRIDAVGYSRSERPFVAEIELSANVLESPRALLEDVAILHSRYGFPVDAIDAVSIVLTLPNVRSEYYQVMRDIEAVLGMRCRTITVGALVAMVWIGQRLEGFEGTAFAVGDGAVDLSTTLVAKEPALSEPYAGAFRPGK